MATSVFSDSDSEASNADSDDGGLKVNEKFRSTFMASKDKAALSRKHGLMATLTADGDALSDSDSDESSDEDGKLLTREKDAQILGTLQAIRARSSTVKDRAHKFYESSSSDDEDEHDASKSAAGTKSKGKKTMTVRDLIIADAELAASGDLDGHTGAAPAPRGLPARSAKLAYNKEQKDLLSAFTKAASSAAANAADAEESGDSDLEFVPTRRGRESASRATSTAAARAGAAAVAADDAGIVVNDDEAFLQQYIRNEFWKKRAEDVPDVGKALQEAPADLEEDEDLSSEGDEFEIRHQMAQPGGPPASAGGHSGFQFRFQEPGGAQLTTFPREIDQSLRRVESKRKKARDRKKERVLSERQRLQEEVKRLKNLKKQEIRLKLDQVAETAGMDMGELDLKGLDLEGDFDPEKYDKIMSTMFDDDYYEKSPIPSSAEHSDAEADEADEAEAGAGGDSAKSQRKAKRAKLERDEAAARKKFDELQKKLDEYYSLDFEGLAGGEKTRFSYVSVPKENFGLSTEQILATSDKDLNQLVSVKAYAPYRPANEKTPAFWSRYTQSQDHKAKLESLASKSSRSSGAASSSAGGAASRKSKPKPPAAAASSSSASSAATATAAEGGSNASASRKRKSRKGKRGGKRAKRARSNSAAAAAAGPSTSSSSSAANAAKAPSAAAAEPAKKKRKTSSKSSSDKKPSA